MNISEIKNKIPKQAYEILSKEIKELRPAQEKAVKKGLFNGKNLLICTPTASGKTLIAELASLKRILEKREKAVYIVPLRALANEKFKDFKKRYENLLKIALSIGNLDSADNYLMNYDIIICSTEKLDSLIRHHTPWLNKIGTIIIDEIHMMNDFGRGPTLEILITLLRDVVPKAQLIALSATIGNPEELAEWLDAELIIDDWRPVKLEKGILHNSEIEFF